VHKLKYILQVSVTPILSQSASKISKQAVSNFVLKKIRRNDRKLYLSASASCMLCVLIYHMQSIFTIRLWKDVQACHADTLQLRML